MEDCLAKYIVMAVLLSADPMVQGFRATWKRSMYPFREQKSTADEQKVFFKHDTLTDRTTLSVGENIDLVCEAAGRPPPTIHWLFNGKRISQPEVKSKNWESFGPDTFRLGTTKARLHKECITSSEAGEYTCVAQTPFHRITTSTQLSIDDQVSEAGVTNCMLETLIKATPPVIYMWSTQRLEFEGNDVQLFCRAKGSPPPKITWFDPRRNLIDSDDSTYQVMDNGDLLIKSLNWQEHMGRFKCVAENTAGTDTKMTFVYPTTPN